MNRATRTGIPFLTLLLPLAAQEQAPPDLIGLLSELVVPIHTQPADPDGGEYGIWCAGPDYKASFHDGFAFYPLPVYDLFSQWSFVDASQAQPVRFHRGVRYQVR